jgi:transposase
MCYASLMGRASEIHLTEEDRSQLEAWLRKGTVEQRMVQRARIVLESAAGRTTKGIALDLKLRAATVSKWRTRFFHSGMSGLMDAPRSGRKPKYDGNTERRILTQLDSGPPTGYSTWTGRLLASALGDVSPHHIWRVLRRHGIHLQRRRS